MPLAWGPIRPTSISSRVGMGSRGVLKVDVDEFGVDMFEAMDTLALAADTC